MNQLDPSVKTVWSLQLLLRSVLFAGIFLAVELLFIKPNLNWPIFTGLIPAALFVLGVIFAIVFPILHYKYWAFEIRSDELYIVRGVITRVKTTAPFVRIQHIDVEQNVFERMTGLAKLIVYTAGSRGADLVVPGLPLEYAEALRDRLKNITAEDAV